MQDENSDLNNISDQQTFVKNCVAKRLIQDRINHVNLRDNNNMINLLDEIGKSLKYDLKPIDNKTIVKVKSDVKSGNNEQKQNNIVVFNNNTKEEHTLESYINKKISKKINLDYRK